MVVSFFDYSGNMLKPWAVAGHTCLAFDIDHDYLDETIDGVTYVGRDILLWRDWIEDYIGQIVVSFASFFPPCTDVAVSGAKHFKGKGLGKLIDALRLFKASIDLADALNCPYMIENPVSTISTYWRKPDYNFHPWEFAGYPGGENDTYPKKTCLWTGGGFVMPDRKCREQTDNRIHLMPPSDERARMRSETPMGFAQAVYEAQRNKTAVAV